MKLSEVGRLESFVVCSSLVNALKPQRRRHRGRAARMPYQPKGVAGMKAEVGDWLVLKGLTIDSHERRGLITGVRNDDGSPPYVVHWLDDDHEATVFPGSDAVVVTAAEQKAEDQRENRRITSFQDGVAHHFKSE